MEPDLQRQQKRTEGRRAYGLACCKLGIFLKSLKVWLILLIGTELEMIERFFVSLFLVYFFRRGRGREKRKRRLEKD